tara:strand:+ start:34 stop:477 length:444 start_codon:yes stop_codon:yes gene_type:complete
MDFTLESALLYISQTNPTTEQEFKNREKAQKVIKESGLSRKELNELRKKVLQGDKEDKKMIKYQQMKPKQKDMVDSMGKMGIGMKNNKGGAILKKNVEKMAYGGMSGGKKHMYLAPGGVVKDNPGLKALRASGPKGMEAYKKITGSK